MCNEQGGTKDDLVILKLEQELFLMIYNAINREKNYSWLKRNVQRFKVDLEQISDRVAMFSLQGPKAQLTLQKLSAEDVSTIRRFCCKWISLEGSKRLVSRTGYTGEDGFEVFVWNASLENPERAAGIWNRLIEAGSEFKIEPCGLGARDVLRLEAGMCLYGSELDETISPLEARIGYTVKFDKGEFIGKDALLKQKSEGLKRLRVGMRVRDRGIPRANCEILKEGKVVGKVTSGTFSPILQRGIAIGYVPTEYSGESMVLGIRVREKILEAEVMKFPFFDTEKYGRTRAS